ncbi:protein ycf2 a [Phtheirospermum japonicum]|uniref:Protein ycf2 a n=1 Tax=Phtheirospermum japonicum TaxID=374723 RepID=A0A830CNJ5_9LAMI|nr:protein ycf2 a [Phtheirospermum japonicum]
MILSMFLISSREISGLFLCKVVLNFICGDSARISSLVEGRICVCLNLIIKQSGSISLSYGNIEWLP